MKYALTLVIGIFVGSISATYGYAAFRDCRQLNGFYESMDSRNRNLKIEWDEPVQSLMLDYNQDPSAPEMEHQEFYLPDGQRHLGDVVQTGDSYIATCTEDGLTLEREFPQLSGRLKTQFTLDEDGGLIRIDGLGDYPPEESGRFRRVH